MPSDVDLETVVSRIRKARDQAGLSQGQVAKLLGMHRPTISEIEAGRRKVTVADLVRFADLFGVSVEWLAGQRPESLSAEDARIAVAARDLERLAPADLDRVLSFIATVKGSA